MNIEEYKKAYRDELAPLSYLDEEIDRPDLGIRNGFKVSDTKKTRKYAPVYVYISNIAGIRLSDEESIHLFDLCGENLSYTIEAENYVKNIFDSHVEELFGQLPKKGVDES